MHMIDISKNKKVPEIKATDANIRAAYEKQKDVIDSLGAHDRGEKVILPIKLRKWI
jgi:hypothetical protein